ncbi:MAG: hypothetical protein JXB09_03165 [Deltaproteobacteria bacterium]|nr:hypothetical protein [Deltaproteobacteria bacterium]
MSVNFNPEEWSMSQEREFMENLLCQRFNFFLVLFSLFVAAAAACKNDNTACLILIVGSVMCLMVWLTIYRAHVKHHWIMQEKMYKTEGHPAQIVNDAMDKIKKRGGSSLFSVSRWIGIVIPAFCCCTLFAGALLILMGVIKVS